MRNQQQYERLTEHYGIVREGEGKEGVREQESARVLDYSQGTKLGQNKWDKGGTNKNKMHKAWAK